MTWNALVWVAAAGAAWAGRKAATAAWQQLAGTDHPANPARNDTSWSEAVGWAVFAGVVAASARVLARKGAATAWESVTGEAPPGV